MITPIWVVRYVDTMASVFADSQLILPFLKENYKVCLDYCYDLANLEVNAQVNIYITNIKNALMQQKINDPKIETGYQRNE